MKDRFWFRNVSFFLWLAPAIVVFKMSAASDVVVGALPGGGVIVPTKQILHAPGRAVHFRGRPVDLAIAPSGRTIYLKNFTSLLVVDVSTWTLVQRTNFPGAGASSFHGIVVSHDGAHVYATGLPNVIYDWKIDALGLVASPRTIYLGTNSDPCGIVLSRDDGTAYVCLGRSNTLAVIDLATGVMKYQIRVGVAPWGVTLSRDGAIAYVSDWGGRHPAAGELTGNSAGTPIVVDERGIAASGAASIVDLKQTVEIAEVPTGLHPSDLVLSHDGKSLFVANANSDTVTVIDTETKSVRESILVRPDPTLPVGSATDGLALSRDGATLYAANGGNNAIAVIELPNDTHTNSLLQGFIPSDWYPGALAADSFNLYVVNVKGVGSETGDVYQFTGSANKIPLPETRLLQKYTVQMRANGRIEQMLEGRITNRASASAAPAPVPVHLGEPSVFKHVLYIIKENKTYDQVFGDIATGNGNARLCIYPRSVTPNHHALAEQYVLLDNYYCNGVYSTDGHSWCTEANATDYWEKSLGAINRSGQIGIDPLEYSSSGFIWNNILQHGLTFYNYGVMGLSFPQAGGESWSRIYADYTNHAGRIRFSTYLGDAPFLQKYSSTNVSGFNLTIPDQVRADGFLKEFNHAQSNGVWPTFNMLYLPDDHTAGTSPNYPTPRAQVADNDLALGRVVEAVTKSIFASNTVIFVIEDDPQSGYDHVDGHRSFCLVISPYTKRGQTISTFYNQTGLIHTMEQIMGLPPMNQMDAMGPLMGDCFTNQPNFTPYTALPNVIPLNEMNPGTLGALSRQDRYWARQSEKMDFSKPDLADDNVLNRAIWHSLKGNRRYPVEFVGAHGKGLTQLGLLASKTAKADNDD